MKNIICIEELFFPVLTFYRFTFLDFVWWWFALLFFVPDLSFIAYAAGPKVGGIVYDVLHHRGLLIAGYLFATAFGIQVLQLVSFFGALERGSCLWIWLEYLDSPNHTHLGEVGKEARS
jgi:hypothetical protein